MLDETLDTTRDVSQAVRETQIRLLKIIALLALASISIIWIFEISIIHHISLIDQIGYPFLIITMISVLAGLQIKPKAYPVAALFTAITFAFYEVVFLQAVFWEFITDVYTISTFALWSPLLYIVVFIFLEGRQAAILSALIYFSLIIPNLVKVGFDFSFVQESLAFPILLHMICSHPFYITTLILVGDIKNLLAKTSYDMDAAKLIANMDYLTKIPNRRAISQLIQIFLSQAQESNITFSVIIFDIDEFKVVNDTYGHDIGDQVLVSVAEIVKQNVRDEDIFGRWGGEEFLVISTQIDPAAMAQLAERLRVALERFEHPQVGQVTASFGATLSSPNDTNDLLLKRADTALYTAKAKGRNQVQVI